MNVISLSLVLVIAQFSPAASDSDELLVLTPNNAEELGYWVRCSVKEKQADRRTDPLQPEQPAGPVSVRLRIGLVTGGRLHEEPFAINAKDLEVIGSFSLVFRDGEGVLRSKPLKTQVDPGNYIHLRGEFSAQRETLSNMLVVFEEQAEHGTRTVVMDLAAFVEKRELSRDGS